MTPSSSFRMLFLVLLFVVATRSAHSSDDGSQPSKVRLLERNQVQVLEHDPLAGLQLSVACLPHGMNVTVHSAIPYSGAMYAAERYRQCHTVVTRERAFWLFLPLPHLGPDCNIYSQGTVMSATVVLSNDNLYPYEVTTDRDLFYRVLCDGRNVPALVTLQAVFRAESPRGSPVPIGGQAFRARMEVTRQGQPVRNVVLGDQLTLTVHANTDPNQVAIDNCNATRFAGFVQNSASDVVPLIIRGCPVYPSILSAFRRTPAALEASLRAFKLDGSDELQILCGVRFCAQGCQQTPCFDQPLADQPLEALLLGSGEANSSEATSAHRVHKRENGPILLEESVGSVLHVYTDEGQFLADGNTVLVEEEPRCIERTTFVAVAATLLALLLLSSCCCVAKCCSLRANAKHEF